MMESHLFKIWNRTRTEKTLVLVNGTDGALNRLISKGESSSIITIFLEMPSIIIINELLLYF